MKILARCIRFVPVIGVMGTIFFLSHQPDTALHVPSFPGLDKLAHGVVYAGLAAAAFYAVPRDFFHTKPGMTGLVVVLFCLLYGVSDEYHQTFIPGREASFWDIVADTIGATLFVFFWLRHHNPDRQGVLQGVRLDHQSRN